MKNLSLRAHALIATVLVAISTFAVYFIMKAVFILPIASSVEAGPIDQLFDYHYWVIAGLFSLIMVFLLYAVIVFRRREGEEGDGVYMHGNTALEVAWTVAPLGLVVVFAVLGSNMLVDLVSPKENELVVKVTGRQWSWSFTYPDQGNVEIADLILPIDRPVVLQMESEDVLHSFWVPEFRVKQDLIPGRMTELRFTPSRLTDTPYQVRCAEICGTSHSYMLANVHVVASEAAYAEAIDLAAQLPVDPVARGERWYVAYGCNGCHSLDGSEGSGPTWAGIYGRNEALTTGVEVLVDDAYIEKSILDPNADIVAGYNAGVMTQTFGQQFADAEAAFAADGFQVNTILEITEFMKTLQP